MRKTLILLIVTILFCRLPNAIAADELDNYMENYHDDENAISDPLEPVNRFFFQFNDKIFLYLLNPVSKGYARTLPEDIRMCIGNAFHNIFTPIRLINNLLQGKIGDSGTELARFLINTTAGAGGLADPAKNIFDLQPTDEDLGQTLGSYGIGEGIYFVWPLLGPSNLRDTVGLIGDSFLSPLTYISDSSAAIGSRAGEMVNKTSLSLGQYEQFLESSFDPYIAMRDFYVQNRKSRVLDKDTRGEQQNTENAKAVDVGIAMFEEIPSPSSVAQAEEPLPYKKIIKGESNDFFIQVGVFRDPLNIQNLVERLTALEKEPVVVEYSRPDYTFYGVAISGGKDFITAKQAEKELGLAGFQETLVVTY